MKVIMNYLIKYLLNYYLFLNNIFYIIEDLKCNKTILKNKIHICIL